MRARCIFCIAILVTVVFPECLSLEGGEDAVCREFAFPTSLVASTFSNNYDDYRDQYDYDEYYSDEITPRGKSHVPIVIEKCCEGYANNSGTCEPQCESRCENGHCSKPGKCACNDGYKETSLNTCSPICDRDCINGYCTSPNQCTCNDGFVRDEDERGSCVPICKTSCNQGICTSRGCACSFGWVGESCDEPLFCTVTQPANVSVVNEQNPSAKPTMIKIEDENYQFKLKWPICSKQCLDQLNTTAVNLTRTNGITTHNQYFVPVDSSCNVIETRPELSMWSSSVMWTVIGIASIAVLVFIGFIFMRIRQRTRIMQ